MIVAPLIFTMMIRTILVTKNQKHMIRIVKKTLFLFLTTAFIASLIGLTLGILMPISSPGSPPGISQNTHAVSSPPMERPEKDLFGFMQNRSDKRLPFIPESLFNVLTSKNILQVLLLAVIIGIILRLHQAKTDPINTLVIAGADFMQIFTAYILKLTPFGIFGITATTLAQTGLSSLLPLLHFIFILYLACCIHIVFTYGGLLWINGIHPWSFLKAIAPALIMAYTSSSSIGSLPVTTHCANENLKLLPKYSGFILPLGANINMDACGGIYPALAALFLAQYYGIELFLSDYIIICFTAVIASVGTAGIPGAAITMLSATLLAVGLPLEGIALLAGIDRILDMMRTMTNVTGDLVTATLVAKSEKDFPVSPSVSLKEP